MTKARTTILSAGAMMLAMGVATPSYAHWGPLSAAATYGNAQYCTHSDPGNINVRRARVKLILNSYYVSYENGGYPIYWDTIEIKNVSAAGRIDASAIYEGPAVDPSSYAGIVIVNDLDVGLARIVGGWWETNGSPSVSRARCSVTNG